MNLTRNFSNDVIEKPQRDNGKEIAWNFYLKQGDRKLVLITSPTALKIHMHNLYKMPQFTEFDCVCLADTDESDKAKCPLCEVNNYASPVAAFSVIPIGDITEDAEIMRYENEKTGEPYPFQHFVWKLKSQAFNTLNSSIKMKLKKKAKGSWEYVLLQVERTDEDKSPSSGNVFLVEGKFNSYREVVNYIADNFEGATTEQLADLIETKERSWDWEDALTILPLSVMEKVLPKEETAQSDEEIPF